MLSQAIRCDLFAMSDNMISIAISRRMASYQGTSIARSLIIFQT
jgi:hypothetical protein